MALEQPDLLIGLGADEAAAVLALGTPVQLDAGAALFRLGDPAESVYLITQGRIALTLPMQLGGRELDVVVQEHGLWETVGWSALIPPHRFTLAANAPLATRLLAFRRTALVDHCAAHPRAGAVVAMNIAALVGRRLQLFQAMWLREMQRTVSQAHA